MIEELYLLCQKELINWCSSITNDRTLAEDLVQEAFLRALTNEELLTTLNEKHGCTGQQKTCMWTKSEKPPAKRSLKFCRSRKAKPLN